MYDYISKITNKFGIKLNKNKFSENVSGFLFIAPNFIGFALFYLFPVFFSLYISFTDFDLFKGLAGSNFIGIQNFIEIIQDRLFYIALLNNLKYTVITLPIIMIVALILSVVINDKVFGREVLRGVFFIPYVAMASAIAIIWAMLFNPEIGPINQFLRLVGVANPPLWLASSKWALPAIMVVSIWINLGYNIVIYTAGLQGIPKILYESAEIDGANFFQKFRHITIPMLTPTTFFLLVTNLIGSFKVFSLVNIMTEGGPGNSSLVLAQYVYEMGFKYFNMGYAAAISWFLMVIIMGVTLMQWRGQKNWVTY